MGNKKLPELTDEQIIEFWKDAVAKGNETFDKDWCMRLSVGYANATLALINRKNVEIERLNIRNKTLRIITKNYDWKFGKAKAEAIKELLLRAKECEKVIGEDNELKPYILVEDLNRIAKEMMGDKKRGIE